jgi:hypothetical protein
MPVEHLTAEEARRVLAEQGIPLDGGWTVGPAPIRGHPTSATEDPEPVTPETLTSTASDEAYAGAPARHGDDVR